MNSQGDHGMPLFISYISAETCVTLEERRHCRFYLYGLILTF